MELGHKSTVTFVDTKVPPAALYRVAYLTKDFEQYLWFSANYGSYLQIEYFEEKDDLLNALQDYFPADVIIAHVKSEGWALLDIIRGNAGLGNLPFIILVDKLSPALVRNAKEKKADDIFATDFTDGDLLTRLHYFTKRQWYVAQKASQKIQAINHTETPFWKRAIDVVSTGGAVILLSPVFLLVAAAIRLDSKGPVFYKSKRVGSGYKIFDLYKFRTMRTDADQMIRKMAAFNMYNNKPAESAVKPEDANLCEECRSGGFCNRRLFLDGKEICEKVFQNQKEQKAAFMKFQNDPRITRIGKFLRNSSLDELPQLINILKGDMSLVGNRPLPLYEAEKMTTDDKILRFAGPAGLTGLWQVTKRGKGKADMSEEERAELDITYAKNFSFKMDMMIILKTFPALLQSENV
ncbi:sugar transferase [Dyadobacter psychrotolerans]|uniref:Sugar transferase n=1 Tax=Dyadobacter psychrotolerans TaxID=2541721 RepID=A0A4R5D9G9_9BACT|nr:sugar transferase [Dyadobacter psychrotolerans]TDE10242.1 sugar transferase [Dyadobacter psychrotolerans]